MIFMKSSHLITFWGLNTILYLRNRLQAGNVWGLKAVLVVFFIAMVPVPRIMGGVPKGDNFSAVLAAVPGAEMPKRAAELVFQAEAAKLGPTTVSVVKAAVGLNPAAVLAVVGSVSEVVPSMAATASGTAASLQPHQAVAIARAASASSPKMAGPIVEAVCRAAPADYRDVSLAVVREVPGSDQAILAGLAEAIPAFKGEIEKCVAKSKEVRVEPVLEEVAVADSVAQLLAPVDHTERAGGHGRVPANLPSLEAATGEAGNSGGNGVTQPNNVAVP